MAQQQSPWLEGAYGWNFGEGGWNTGMDQNLIKFSFMFDRNVDSITAALPAAVNGQAHYLTTDNRLYFAVGTTYFSTVVPKWLEFKVRSTGNTYQFNGTSAVQIDSPAQVDARIDAVELTVSTLGTAAFESVEFFATQSELDVASATAASYTDELRTSVASVSLATEGAGQVGYDSSLSYPVDTVGDILKTGAIGFERAPLTESITTVSGMLSASWVNVWEYASLITVKPDPMDPLTWDWQPAIQSAVDSGAGVCYFPGPFVYNTESTVIVDKQVRLIGDAAKRLGSPIGTRIYNTGTGDTIIYSNTGAIYDAGIENLGISAAAGHALNIKYGAVRCHFKQLYLYTQHTGRSCIAGIYNAGTPGVDYIGTYSSVFEGGEYIVDNVARTAPIVDFLANGTLVNGNCFRNLWVTNSNGRPAIRLMATTAGVLLTNNIFDGVVAEVCSGGAILLQANQGTRIKGLRAWDTPAGYNASVILVSNDTAVAQTKGLIIEDYARMSDPLNGASVDIDFGYSLDSALIGHNSNVVGKIEFRARSCVVIGAVNATVTNDAAVTYIAGAALTAIAATVKGALAHTGTTAGFFGKAPVTQRAASADTTGATLAQVEAAVNVLKGYMRDLGFMAP